MTITPYKQNDRLPEYTVILTAAGSPINLTGATVSFHMRNRRGGATKVYAAAVVVDAAAGDVKYPWAAVDLDTVGSYSVEWEITFSDGRTLTVPADGFDVVKVEGDIGPP